MARNDSTTAVTTQTKKKKVTALIIIRHAERLDDHRIPGGFVKNNEKGGSNKKGTCIGRSASPYDWRYDTEAGRSRPWDPPLSYGGIEQSEAFGRLLPRLIEDFKLPPLGAAYASPVVRCVETALAAVRAHDAEALAMEKEREEAREKREAMDNATAGDYNNGSGGGWLKTKGKKNKIKVQTSVLTSPRSPTSQRGPDMTTALGTAHVRVPSISNLYNAALDMFGIEDESAMVANSDCADTTTVALTAHKSICLNDKTDIQKTKVGFVKVKLEQGLMECIHKPWYDQWCLVPGIPGGSGKVVLGEHRMTLDDTKDCSDEKREDDENTHPMARVSVAHCFPEPRHMVDLLGGVIRSYIRKAGGVTSDGTLTLLPDKDSDQRILQDMLGRVDTTKHLEPFSTFSKEYTYNSQYETGKSGLNRQHAAVRAIAAHHVGETILCVTHFVPCAHIFGRLTGRDGVVEHGKAGYTAFSVYVHSDGREGEKHKDWRPLIINDQRHLAVPRQEPVKPARKKYNLRSRLYGF